MPPKTPKIPGAVAKLGAVGAGKSRETTVVAVPANKALTEHFNVDKTGKVTISNQALADALKRGIAGAGTGTKAISVGVVVDW